MESREEGGDIAILKGIGLGGLLLHSMRETLVELMVGFGEVTLHLREAMECSIDVAAGEGKIVVDPLLETLELESELVDLFLELLVLDLASGELALTGEKPDLPLGLLMGVLLQSLESCVYRVRSESVEDGQLGDGQPGGWKLLKRRSWLSGAQRC